MARADKYSNNVITVEGTGEKVKVSELLKVDGKHNIVTLDLRYFIEEGFLKFKYREVTDPVFKKKCFDALEEKLNKIKKYLG